MVALARHPVAQGAARLRFDKRAGNPSAAPRVTRQARAARVRCVRPRRPAPACARLRRLLLRLIGMAAVLPVLLPAPAQAATDTVGASAAALSVGPDCSAQVRLDWPLGLIGRRARIATMQRLRPLCLDDAAFLATLGALLLEDGDAAQALLWLERAVLLDPEALGARVDLALALAELGQPDALHELSQQLRHRADLPPALRARLYPDERRNAFALPAVRLGHALRPAWSAVGEISLLVGREGNLDRSPDLSELTLTLPDGPLTLPLESRPRAGAAALTAAALEIGYVPQPATALRSGLILGARAAPARHATDWRQWQWVLGLSHAAYGVRGSIDFGLAGVDGPLSEPYRLRRLTLAAESAVGPCRSRLALDREHRVQSLTTSLNAAIDTWLGALQCPLGVGADWVWALDARLARDRPAEPERPGGTQRSRGAGLRVAGSLGDAVALELAWFASRTRDAHGYSPLLENNAIRRIGLHQLSVEISAALYRAPGQRLDALLKWQAARQVSNLSLFRYRADSSYAGLRWRW